MIVGFSGAAGGRGGWLPCMSNRLPDTLGIGITDTPSQAVFDTVVTQQANKPHWVITQNNETIELADIESVIEWVNQQGKCTKTHA